MSRTWDQETERTVIEIALKRPEGSQDWFLDWMKVRWQGACNVVRCTAPEPVESAFVPAFGALMRPYLPPRGATPALLAAEGPFPCDMVQLAQLRVLIGQPREGADHMMLRFQHALGPALSILAPRLRPQEASASQMETQAARMLADLLDPCLNLAALDPETGRDHVQAVAAQLEALRGRHEEMSFFSHLLRRFLSHGPQAFGRAVAGPEPATPRLRELQL
ncbi:hypothetical protein KM176_10380 [Pseudooceanicola sp. CBS1P-1]|uniref:Uncharacterized protein n=1 Tax=Pseudooceanicola albus TaxID=2692189 RepID=A0A6L7G9Z3_9RHOB|nr:MULTISPECIES: hypothetical protein [Pseudooceanicola]MBT9384263.1 hypothetical protein [Pseudooceanicola endophyticus]MXN20855.1 hypothetical protein [Pseudooceanicola albus]